MNATGVIVVFECLHTQMFSFHPPKTGERIYCPRCEEYKTVATAPHDYSIRCDTCQLHREYGNAPIASETAAAKHAIRKAGHRVVLFDLGERVREFHHAVIEMSSPPF